MVAQTNLEAVQNDLRLLAKFFTVSFFRKTLNPLRKSISVGRQSFESQIHHESLIALLQSCVRELKDGFCACSRTTAWLQEKN